VAAAQERSFHYKVKLVLEAPLRNHRHPRPAMSMGQ
jgi:hypothetical protein